MTRSLFIALAVASSFGAPAFAQSTTAVAGPLPITGNVPSVCTAGAISGGSNVFGVGVLVDTSTGFLLNTLSVPAKTLSGSFCNTRSTIAIAATRMTAQSSGATPPAGFTNAVNFTATASGWTPTAAATSTGTGTNPGANQLRDTAFAGDIVVSLSNFAPAGGPLRLVADPEYRGTVTVTLAAAN
ncbi:hypothetical protein [Brevundimonas sp. Root1423]|uniref:hypothetical protein n=1 Tax=Brevundimonas sp. Root1423 TaxID=1736462 RepID=UPI0006F3E771|nr:hypothetical protein [Brevundimonas sp. Root1423]KQY75385.1 hypothetical protein ASD25_12685 [Brevundimonas sp. Root1423]